MRVKGTLTCYNYPHDHSHRWLAGPYFPTNPIQNTAQAHFSHSTNTNWLKCQNIIRIQQTKLPDYTWKCMTGYMRLDILHCDALVNNQLLLHIVCFFVVGSLNSTVVNQLHHAQCTSTFFSILKPNCIIECTSPHNLCAIHGHADNKCKELVWDPKVFFFKHRTWFLSWYSIFVNCSH